MPPEDPNLLPRGDAPAADLAFGHFLVPRRASGSPWELGRGAMGVTYRAFDTSLQTEVALKVIRSDRVSEDVVRRRFQREARSAAKVRHPNIASVLYLGEQGGEFFYAMEFVPGHSLDNLLGEMNVPLPPVVAVALAAQVAAALNAAHKSEVVHRDLKPANLMLLEGTALNHTDERTRAAGDRLLKVIDFGLARSFAAERHDESLVTQTATSFVGTPAYASPEQAAGAEGLDGRSDLYSLGIIFWQMLTGRLPFTGSVFEVLAKHQYQPPPFEQLANLSASLQEALRGLLAKDPAQRQPQSAGELRDALDRLLRESADHDRRVVPAATSALTLAEERPPTEIPAPTLDLTPVRPPEGRRLEDVLRQQGGRLPVPQVVDLLGPLARIVDEAGDVALDLCPAGIWFSSGDHVPVSRHQLGLTVDWLEGGAGRLEVAPRERRVPDDPGQTAATLATALPASHHGTAPLPTVALAGLAYEMLGGAPPALGSGYRPLAECGEDANAILRRALAGEYAGGSAAALAGALDGHLRPRGAMPSGAHDSRPAPEKPTIPTDESPRGNSDEATSKTTIGARRASGGWRRWPAWAAAGAACLLLGWGVFGRRNETSRSPILSPPSAVSPEPAPTNETAQVVPPSSPPISVGTPEAAPTNLPVEIARPPMPAASSEGNRVADALRYLKKAKTAEADCVTTAFKAYILRAIAGLQFKAGDPTAARQNFAQAQTVELGDHPNTDHQIDALINTAVAQSKAGDISEAIETLAQAQAVALAMKDPVYRDSAAAKVAVHQTEVGDMAGAKATAAILDTATSKSNTLRSIAAAQAKAGDVAGAKATAATITDAIERDAAVYDIVAAQAQTGDVDGAKATAAGLKEDYRDMALIVITEAQIKAGDLVAAKVTAASNPHPYHKTRKVDALIVVANAQGKAGDFTAMRETLEQAKNITMSIDERDDRNGKLVEIVGTQAAAGDLEGARATAATIKDARAKGSALIAIINSQAKKGDVTGARTAVAALADPDDQTCALLAVADAQSKAGDAAGASQTLVEARTATAAVAVAFRRDTLLVSIAKAQAEARDVAGAKVTAAATTQATERAAALRDIALAQTHLDDLAGAQVTENEISNDNDKNPVLSAIITERSRLEGFPAAESWIETRTAAWERALCYTTLAEARLKTAVADNADPRTRTSSP